MVGFGMTVIDASADSARKDAPTYLFKLVLIGDAGTGKSATIMKFAQDRYTPEYLSTIGVDFAIKMVEVAGELVKLQIWDTAGQERFRTITNSYYRGSQGIFVFYDLTDKATFDNVERWVHEIQRYAQEDVSIIVVGTKADLEDKREVTDEDIKGLAKELELEHFEVSCVTGEGIHRIFERMVEKLIVAKKIARQTGGQMSIMVGPIKKSSKKSDQTDEKKSKTCIIL